jgi:chromosomal replication initiation ATPase DnaA
VRAGLRLDDADIAWLALRITGNPRRLVGAVLRIAAYAGVPGQSLGGEYLRELAAPWLEPGPGTLPPVSPQAVLQAVCAEFSLTAKQLRSRERSPRTDRARQLAMLLLRDECALSFGEIGRVVGNRANSTVLEGIASLRTRIQGDRSLALLRERVAAQVCRQRTWSPSAARPPERESPVVSMGLAMPTGFNLAEEHEPARGWAKR